jgi:hypothetical protein
MRILVVAANLPHFRDWCNEHQISPRSSLVEFISQPEHLAGIDPNDVVFEYHPLWHLNPKAGELQALIHIIMARRQGLAP